MKTANLPTKYVRVLERIEKEAKDMPCAALETRYEHARSKYGRATLLLSQGKIEQDVFTFVECGFLCLRREHEYRATLACA
jgi:hypothetical protein